MATTVACCELLAEDERLPESVRDLACRALVAALAAADDAAAMAGGSCTESAEVDR